MIQEQELREQVERCRRLARDVSDERARKSLTELAAEYEEELRRLKTRGPEERSFAPNF